jgi:PPP family 3-phenylpropionic acid transporter
MQPLEGGTGDGGLPGRLVSLRLALFYIAFFLFIGVNMPFWPAWLKARGMGPEEIGSLMAAALWIRVISNPLLARLADRRGETRRPLVVLLLLALGAYGLFAVAEGYWALLGVTLLGSIVLSAILPLSDSLTMHAALRRRVDYGRVRLWGSLSFILASFGGGLVLAGRPADLILYGLLLALALSAAAAFALPDWRRAPAPRSGAGLMTLLADRRFMLFLLAASLVQASHSVLYAFGTLHWQAAGHAKDTIGWLWAEGVIAEVLLFAVGTALLRRIEGTRLLMFAGAAAAVRWVALGFSTELPVLMAVQVLHGLTFGAAHLAAMDVIARSAPPGLAATAQSLYSAIATGAVFGLTMLFAGALYAAHGGGAFYVMAAMAMGGMLLAALLVQRGRTTACPPAGNRDAPE